MREIKKIVLHCSDSIFGNAKMISRWHKAKSWKDIGYHFVILNGRIERDQYFESMSGSIEVGRNIETMGAHVKGHNSDSIGICLIGVDKFSTEQLYSLLLLLAELMKKYDIKSKDIHGHYEFSSKTCPNFDVDEIRTMLDDQKCCIELDKFSHSFEI